MLTDTPTPEISPTNVSSEYTIDGSCDICHKTKKLKEYRYETITYAVCEDCYNNEILGYEYDNEVYSSLYSMANISMADEKILKESAKESIILIFGSLGVLCTNDVLEDYLKAEFEMDLSQPSKVGSYEITIENGMVKRTAPPKHPLAE